VPDFVKQIQEVEPQKSVREKVSAGTIFEIRLIERVLETRQEVSEDVLVDKLLKSTMKYLK
jgi:hypothetical protein